MPKTFGEVLKEARKQQGLKALDVVKATGIKQATYSKYENDKTEKFSVKSIEKLCSFLHIDANHLFHLDIDETVIISAGVDYQQKIIAQLSNCIEEIKETNYESLKNFLKHIVVKEDENIVEIQYQQPIHLSWKNDSLKPISFCCIITCFVKDILEIIQEEMQKNDFDPKLVRLYRRFANILIDFLSN